jgi:A-macroglobulin TED domain/Alpha-2-macroglobulin family/MG2 domain/Carboxypeptidase regulatory-like domain/Macroglobulin domain MG3/A-macroglobulin receptor binding domain
MSRFWWLLLGLWLATAPALPASAQVHVDESKTQLQIGASDSRLKLALRGAPVGGLSVRVELELLDPKDRIVKAFSHEASLNRESGLLEIPLGAFLSELSQKEQAGVLWFRLRYRLKPAKSASDVEAVEGVLSLSEISKQPFQLKLGLPQYGVEGTRCRVHVFTSHPASGRPVRGVTVKGTLTIQEEKGEHVLTDSGLTDSSGYAALDFELPGNLEDPDAKVSVKAQLGGVVRELSEDLEFQDQTAVLLSTDKPLYQPGQALRVRVLAFDASRKALAQSSLTVRIKDPEGTQVYRSELATSRFGEANTEWSIPENARLGDYLIEVDQGGSSRTWAESIKVSRYDLPNFTVSVKPDRSYYLADQSAEISIRADYLFGRPVKKGRVKVVREMERRWNYREQKYETKEGQTVEGELDAEGQFLAKIDLASEHAELAGHDYQRYADLRFAAYATDPTTNRTEQRRFELRLTKHPIHVYVTRDRNASSAGLPLEFYLSTSYADGTPAKCEVAVREVYQTQTEAERTSQLLRIVKTNRYGVAKIGGLRTTPGWKTDQDDPLLQFLASDGKGGRGEHSESFWSSGRSAIRIHTSKTLYRASEPLEVEIESSLKSGTIVLDVTRRDRVLHSRLVRLRNGKAFVVIPYVPEFKDDLTLAAYSADNPDDSYETPTGVRQVLYPRNRELKVGLRLGQTTYEPGQEASATFRVRTADGVAKESLLGVVVLDKAVEERARTDGEFGSAYGFYATCARLLGFDRELSGLTRRDLDRLDLSQPVAADLELAADVLLNSWPGYYSRRLIQEDSPEHPREVFKSLVDKQLAPLKNTLESRYANDRVYPRDVNSLRDIATGASLNLGELKDPWNVGYQFAFSTMQSLDVLEIVSAGPDKQFDSADDIPALRFSWPYFRPHGENIDGVVKSYHGRTGGFVRDLATLKAELLKIGDGLDAWQDRWGQPYRVEFGILATHFTLTVRSGGPNRAFEAQGTKLTDDFPLWTSSIDYSQETRIEVDQALNRYFHSGRGFAETKPQFQEALSLSKAKAENLQDPWRHPYYPVFKKEYRYSDRPTIVTYSDHLKTSQRRASVVPVTSQVQFLVLRSAGPDGAEGTSDDFDVATFSRLLMEQSSKDSSPQPAVGAPILEGLTGAITGVISDQTGAVVPGATVKATRKSATGLFEAKSDDSGRYLLRNLPAGFYDVRFEMAGFLPSVIRSVPVQSSAATELNITLRVGEVTQTVEVSAGAILIQSESAQVAQVHESVSIKLPAQSSTPRLREYFPETLVWQPSLETDRSGRAQLKFKLADNITTWKMAVVASTVDGQIGMAEKEILAFQPFFLEHDPPRVLTEGDEIALPVVLRNYLDKEQAVELSIKPESWFATLDAASKKTSVKAGDAGREIFGFKAIASVKDGKQRITARGGDAGDAIEKPVTVHPDGEEIVQSISQVFKELARLDLAIPAEVIPKTAGAELKIYPNLMAHVVEAVEGVLQRPYGCGEQTISSTYPSLMLLRSYKEAGTEPPQLAQKARRYLQSGYERLLGYRAESGGFSYWGSHDADVALTAYALRFLHDASGFVAVDESVLKRAYEWLVRQQQADGSWTLSWQSQMVPQYRLNLTSLVARVLSMPGLREVTVTGSPRLKGPQQPDPVRLALQFLHARAGESDEPYAVASFGLTALNLGESETAEGALKRLESTVKREQGGAYWHLQANTPFYSWGLPGRLETTALAVRALALSRVARPSSTAAPNGHESLDRSREALIRQALLFLLRNKDRYGVWHSSQATVNVLDAMIGLLGNEDSRSALASTAEILVNGQPAGSLSWSNRAEATNPVTVNVSKFLVAGGNSIEVRRGAGSSEATVQLLETHYVPWLYSSAEKPKAGAASSSALRLSVRFNKTEAKIGEDITCHVEVERIGFRGYGMLLGEIGLPPGADVDRSSLDEAIKTAGWDLYRYDVLPDRLIVYLWPRAGGTKFDFKFRPRYGIKAQTAASAVYDYYNPEARAVVRPAKFAVQ